MPDMWKRYEVKLDFTGRVMAGIPKHPDIIKSWLEARMPTFAPPDAVPLEELADEVALAVSAVATQENKVWCGFMGDESGIYVPGFHLKAHLKDAANTTKDFQKIKALKSKVADRVFVEEDRLYFQQRGKKHVMTPDGYWEHAVHVMTMQGPRSALKRNDYVENPVIIAHLRVLEDNVVKESVLRELFTYGSVRGFGSERGLGNGRYEFELKAL